jgi:hypothetical protein
MLLTDETTALALLRAAFPDGRGEYHHDGWVFYVKGGRWLADPPPDCVPIWGPEPLEAADPIELAKLCSEAETSQAVCDMREEQAAWEAGQREAGRERRERSWAAVMAPGSFMNPAGTRPPTVSPGPSGLGRIWHLSRKCDVPHHFWAAGGWGVIGAPMSLAVPVLVRALARRADAAPDAPLGGWCPHFFQSHSALHLELRTKLQRGRQSGRRAESTPHP